MPAFTRRRFLRRTGLAALAAGPLGSMSRLAHAGPGDDYKALVCVLLAGGADSFNMLVPFDQTRYDDYARIRSDLALARGTLLPLAGTGPGGRAFALHPALPEIRTLYDQGDLAFVANVGTLAEPTDRAAYDAGTVRLPLGLFSHSDQIAQWQTSVPDRRIATGFGGRVGDVLQPSLPAMPISMNISLSGTNVFQTGATVDGYSIDAEDGVREVGGYGDGPDGSPLFTDALDALLAHGYDDPFRRTYAARLRNAIDSGAAFKDALAQADTITTPFSAGAFSQSLRQIARVIGARDLLGARRQTFFVTFGGWDHHDDLLAQQAQMLPVVSRGLAEFRAALDELGAFDCVTTFTISDFGRTLTSNGRGSDHGWGGHGLAMGGAVRGATVHGDYPELTPDNPLDVGRGRYIPTTSVDAFYADLALWLGVEPGDLERVLPNIRRFYAPESGTPPVGLMV
ncbi:MAG: DUF1501 domain-containing protein [Pseudomonadales bacterium]